jgi:hypothetical protein
MRRTPEGFLFVSGFAARPGVLEYRQADGSVRRELVLPEELHRADSLGSLGLKPVCNEHPADGSFVAPENVQAVSVGTVSPRLVVVEGGYVQVELTVQRTDAVRDVLSGLRRELSPGYECDLDSTPGTHPVYGRFDAIQRNRRYNHLALTERARGGDSLRLRVDSAISDPLFEERPMNPLLSLVAALLATIAKLPDEQRAVVQGEFDAMQAQATKTCDELAAAQERAKAAEAAAATATTEAQAKTDSITGERDALKAEVATLKEQAATRADSDKPEMVFASRMAWAKERAELMPLATRFGVEKTDTLDNPALRRAIAQKAIPDMRTDASDDYVAGALKSLPRASDSRYDALNGEPPSKDRKDSADPAPQGWSGRMHKARVDAAKE